MGFLAFVLIGAVVIGGAVFSYLNNAKRAKALQAYCLNRGWSYSAIGPQLTNRWQGTPFDEGDDRNATNVAYGMWRDHPFNAFDYSYVTTSTDANGRTSRTTHRFGVVTLGLPAYLPNLQVTGEGVLRRFASAVGIGDDIELESEDFNRAFTVKSRDPKFASDVLTPRTMEMLLAGPRLAWRIEAQDIITWDSTRFDPVGILERLDHLSKVVAGIPSFVWHDHGYDPPQTAGGTGGGSVA